MSKADQFWQYAKEAIPSACYVESNEDRQACADLDASGIT